MFKEIWSVILYPFKGGHLIYVISGVTLILAMSAFGQTVEYPVSPGDTLYISVWGQEGLSGPVTVGPDGTIALPPPIGNIYVNQLTANEIAELLTKKLEEYMKQPVVSVSIRSFQGFVVHILGEVILPGFYRVPDDTSLQEVVTQAGGFTEMADMRSITLIRKGDNGEAKEQKVDFSRFLSQGDLESNPIMEPGDRVVVPRISVEERLKRLVTVVGGVTTPGSYEVKTPMSLLGVLALAGGVQQDADLRNVVIMSGSTEGEVRYRRVDLEAVLSGKGDPQSSIPIISPGETVFIPNIDALERSFFVNVVGQVVKPGSYQVAEGARLIDAIFKAGGPADEASIDRITIIRTGPDGSTTSLFSLRDYLRKGDMSLNPTLREGDTIIVPTVETAKTVPPVQTAFLPSISVSVIGEISKPGVYQMSAESNLLDAITLAGGPTTDADMKRTMLIRGGKPSKEQRLIVDVEKVVTEGDLELLPAMSSGDIVLVPKLEEKSDWWGKIINLARDVSIIVGLYYLLIGKRYR